MGGKAILLVVVSFSLTFLLIGNNFNRMSLSALDNMAYYASRQVAHNIALSGANIACNKFYRDTTWKAGYTNVPCQGGTYSVRVQTVDVINEVRRITSISTFTGYYTGYAGIVYHDTIIITFQPASFARFVYYSVKEVGGIYWSTGDTLTGPLHSQDYIFIQGSPYFYGYVSTLMGIFWHGGTINEPTFAGGYQEGVDIPINNMGVSTDSAAARMGGKYFTGHDTVYMKFVSDSIKYRYTWNGVDSTRRLSTFAPNGVIYVDRGTIRIKGVVKGQYTVSCSGVNANQGGQIWLDDDLVYTQNPLEYPDNTDVLGLVAQNNIYVTDNAANGGGIGINIDGSLYCQGGSFIGQNYNNGGVRGYINLIGGVIQNNRGQINTTSAEIVIKGWNKNYKFDTRLVYMSPPVFPRSGGSQIISWYESGLNAATDRNLY